MTHPTLPLHDPPHPTPPHPWNIFGKNIPGFHGLLHYVSLSVDKNSPNNFIYHLSWLKKLSPAHTHPLISIHESLTAYELLLFKLELLIKCLNVNWEKIQLIILSVTCHSLRNLPLLIHPFMTHPTPSWPTPPLHDPPHPYMTHPTPPLHDPPHPISPHPTPTQPTIPHPTPGTFLGTKEPFFMGCFIMSPISVDN